MNKEIAMNIKNITHIFCLILTFGSLQAQQLRVEPPNWWVGMQLNEIQIMVHAEQISTYQPELNYEGVSIKKIHQADSPNYLFIDIAIEEQTKAGNFEILFKKKKTKTLNYTFHLQAREKAATQFVGFDSSDVVYLITPDRFANGNPKNDIVNSMVETKIDRKNDYARHGGDIEGITEQVDYINDMGFTAVWSSPLLENNMPDASYHGYAITDYYQVDARFGSMDNYKALANKLNQNNMKLIMDMVANHCGSEHWWMKDLPFTDWVNYQEQFEAGENMPTSNHRRTTNQDRYASQLDADEMQKGWFVQSMPDLNQQNPFMTNYLIQNSIWWVETLHLGGIRQDTYPYPDKHFMANWAKAIMAEYPNFSIVGEEWSYNPLLVAYWQDGNENYDGYRSYLKSSMDFPLQQAIVDALNEEESWGGGLVKIYEGLANDFVYPSPKNIMLFVDNHDMSRIFTQLKEDVAKTKMAFGLLLTLPRIPQVYYGTEILMNDTAKPGDHGLIRTDFPGGWEDDEINAFREVGLTTQQKEFKLFLKTLLNYRKYSAAIHKGRTIHFAPFNGIYTLFRIQDDEIVMLIINKNKTSKTLDLARFKELNCIGKRFINLHTNKEFTWGETLQIEHGITLFTTKK